MAIQTTRWSPDTCSCVLDYSWDDSVDPTLRIHTPVAVVNLGPEHSAIASPAAVWAQVLAENQIKNIALTNLQTSQPSLFDTSGNPLPGAISWVYDASRTLQISLPTLAAGQKTTFQNSMTQGAVTTGPAAAAASKTASASLVGSSWNFIVFGINQNVMAAGQLLTAQIVIDASVAPGNFVIPVTNVAMTDPLGNSIVPGTVVPCIFTASGIIQPPSVSIPTPPSLVFMNAAGFPGALVILSVAFNPGVAQVSGVQFSLTLPPGVYTTQAGRIPIVVS